MRGIEFDQEWRTKVWATAPRGLGLASEDLDWRAVMFSLRLAGYVIILIGIIDRRIRSRS